MDDQPEPTAALDRVREARAAAEACKLDTSEHLHALRAMAEAAEGRRAEATGRRAGALAALLASSADAAAAATGPSPPAPPPPAAATHDDLQAALNAQRAACAAVLRDRDALIARLAGDLRGRDADLATALAANCGALDELVRCMHAQYADVLAAQEAQLHAVEAGCLEVRSAQLTAHRRQVDGLLQQRREAEVAAVQQRLDAEAARAKELADLQAADAESYQRLKVKLETDVAVLEQQLEHMRFTYLLNAEKLEYNYRVLSERDHENKAALAAHKARLGRLRASLERARAEAASADRGHATRNAALGGDYARVARSYRELQAKFRAFEVADAQKWAELRAMHGDDLRALVDRLAAADAALCATLLPGVPPVVGVPHLPPAAAAAATTRGGAPPAAAGGDDDDADAAVTAVAQALLGDSDGDADAAVVDSLPSLHVQRVATIGGDGDGAHSDLPARLPPVLDALVAACGDALLDAAAHAEAAALERDGKPDEARALLGAALLRTLGCSDAASLASIVDAVEPAVHDSHSCGEAGTEGAAAAVTNALQAWVAERQEAQKSTVEPSAPAAAADDTWREFRDAVPPHRVRTWRSLEAALARFRAALTQRAELNAEVEALGRSNAALRDQLRAALADPGNAGMAVPPVLRLALAGGSGDASDAASTLTAASEGALELLEVTGGSGSSTNTSSSSTKGRTSGSKRRGRRAPRAATDVHKPAPASDGGLVLVGQAVGTAAAHSNGGLG